MELCCPQHRIDFNNDLRRIRDAPVRFIADKLKKNDQVLIKATQALSRLEQHTITLDMLLYDGYDLMTYSSSDINSQTGKKIHWNISYGIEGCDKINRGVIIHKK